jgi:hypothetical protein
VALGLCLAFVATASAPAYAAPFSFVTSKSASVGSDTGYTEFFLNQDGSSTVAGVQHATKAFRNDGSDSYSCDEEWVDYNTTVHRPPDVFVSCVSNAPAWSDYQILHHPVAGGPPLSWAELQSDLRNPWIAGVAICRVDARFGGYARVSGGNCVQSNAGAVDFSGYSGLNYDNLAALNNLNEPEYVTLNRVNNMWAADWILRGSYSDPLISSNAQFTAVMQSDGNFVIYDLTSGHACWATGTHGNNIVKMQTDGNLVMYPAAGGSAIWSTGTSGLGADQVVMSNWGDLRVQGISGIKWSSGTGHC